MQQRADRAIAAVFVLAVGLTQGCASDPPPRRAPATRPPEAARVEVRPVIESSASRLEELRARRWFPSEADAERFRAAMSRVEAALAAMHEDWCATAAVQEYLAAMDAAWQMHQIYRVGEDARTRR